MAARQRFRPGSKIVLLAAAFPAAAGFRAPLSFPCATFRFFLSGPHEHLFQHRRDAFLSPLLGGWRPYRGIEHPDHLSSWWTSGHFSEDRRGALAKEGWRKLQCH